MDEDIKFCKYCNKHNYYHNWNNVVKGAVKSGEKILYAIHLRDGTIINATLREYVLDTVDRMIHLYAETEGYMFSEQDKIRFTEILCKSLGII